MVFKKGRDYQVMILILILRTKKKKEKKRKRKGKEIDEISSSKDLFKIIWAWG